MIGWILVIAYQGFVIPEEWLVNAARIGGQLPAPFSMSGILTSAGTLFGLLAGLAWITFRGGWQASGPVWKRTARYVVGVVGVLIIWNGLGLIFPRGEALLPYNLRFIRYALLGLWISAITPFTFTKLKLS